MSTDPIAGTRTCSDCGVEQPIEAFRRDRSKSLGRSYRCNRCMNRGHIVYASNRYRTDPAFAEAERARRRKRYAETGR